MEHHVYFWLKKEHDNADDRALMEQGLTDLFKIDGVAGGIWGVPAPTLERPVTENSWDYALSMKFDSVADHDAYQVHPDHDVFVNTCKHLWDKVQVRDMQVKA